MVVYKEKAVFVNINLIIFSIRFCLHIKFYFIHSFVFRALFPCGEDLVCIIDDREDVWEYGPNLIHVKPYHFFQHTGDIHAPPELTKCENDKLLNSNFVHLAQGMRAQCKTFEIILTECVVLFFFF